MPFEEAVLVTLGRKLVEALFDFLRSWRPSSSNGTAASPPPFSDPSGLVDSRAVQRHLLEVSKWSSRFQSATSSQQRRTSQQTVPLLLSPEARAVRGPARPAQALAETHLLESASNSILLGNPGSGKTTTLKRLAASVLGTSSSESEESPGILPILLICREYKEGESLYRYLANCLGILFEQRIRSTGGPQHFSAPGATSGQERGHKHEEVEDDMVWEDHVQGQLLQNVLVDFLSFAPVVLLVDGLDELDNRTRVLLTAELTKLARKITGRIIITCRTGDFTRGMEGYEVFELSPLNERQVDLITRSWLGSDAEAFRSELDQKLYSELANRPLFLSYLMIVFERFGELPDQPSSVCRRVIRILLEDWDRDRGVERKSDYSNFHADEKLDFLAALAFQLTYRKRLRTFSTEDLADSYLAIHQGFGLPEAQATQVALELETHTGIMVAGSDATWEFSHLLLQEYLCALYLVKTPVTAELAERLQHYVAPLAVAVALSSNPGAWLGNLVLNSRHPLNWDFENTHSFFSRLAQERPRFNRSEALGHALLKLFHRYRTHGRHTVRQNLDEVLNLQGVRVSVESALSRYKILGPIEGAAGLVELTRSGLHGPADLVPKHGAVPEWLLKEQP